MPGHAERIRDGGTRPNGNQKKGNQTGDRAATARDMTTKGSFDRPGMMMLYSGCTSHITPLEDRLELHRKSDIKIELSDNSTVLANAKGVLTVHWKGTEGVHRVHLSNTLVYKDISMILLSVLVLVGKQIGVLFLPDTAVLIDLQENYEILGYGHHEKDGLFYKSDRHKHGCTRANFTKDSRV